MTPADKPAEKESHASARDSVPASKPRQLIAINAGWLVSDRVIKLAINFAVGILIARHLGPDQFGLLSLGQMLLTLIMPLATFGLPELLLREFARNDRSPSIVFATALRLRLGLSLFAIAIITGAGFALRGDDHIAVLVVLSYALSLIPQAFDTIETRFQSLNRVGSISILKMIASIVFGCFRVLAIAKAMDVVTFALLYSAEVLLVAVLAVYQARRNAIAVSLEGWSREEARVLLTDSFPLMLRMLTISIYMRVDQLIIASMLGDGPLGVYSVATRIAELWYFVPTSIVLAAMPTLTLKYQESPESYHRALARVLRLMVMISIPAAVVISLASGFIVETLFGDAYREAGSALAIQAWAGVFVAIGVGANPWFINTGHFRYGLYQAAAAAIIGTVLNLILVPRLGLVGGSLSMVASYAVSAVLLNLVFATTRPLFYLQMKAFVLR